MHLLCGSLHWDIQGQAGAGLEGRCQELGVPVSDPFSLQATLATPMSIREWTLQVRKYQNDSMFTSSR